MTRDELRAAADALVERSCAEQDLPVVIEDDVAHERLRPLLTPRSPSTPEEAA